MVEDGFASVAKTGEQFDIPLLHHVKGELLLMQDPANILEAENAFRPAIDVARRQAGKSPELRATVSLARTGRRDEGRAMLCQNGWFSEGFDTRDLKEAKALLDELSA